jgi:endonuclease-3
VTAKPKPFPASELVERLRRLYPNPRYELDWQTPLQLLVASILAAQCQDERVNAVTPALFARYPAARDYATADVAELQSYIQTISFCHTKAVAIKEMAQGLCDRFGGQVPPRVEDLVTLPRVARKTANVVLNLAFGVPSGIIVDSHVKRVARRLGLSDKKGNDPIEKDLMRQVPPADWGHLGLALVLHGRYTCTAREPRCGECPLNDRCPRLHLDEEEE